ncbi:prostate stem cell antigen-like [Hippoglossus stenolepis]|uniref:prostate stem cell antigen-like n=1 Tax=Hippoglossus stenolepis TaxID=195615 RepID=UPI00159CAC39|nr:prostate stem cell antigen-like [Hippoglossus stenolepis]
MNRIILQLVAVGFCFAIGQALQCYKCTFGIGNICITSETECKAGEHCFSGTGTAVGVMDIKKKGCLAVADCNKTMETNVPNSNSTVYSMTKMCCNTDLCNAAPGLPGASGLSLALATITALLMAQILV